MISREEKRRYPRVCCHILDEHQNVVCNLSESGLQLKSRRKHNTGETILFSFVLPTGEPINASAKIIWWKSHHLEHFDYGVSFEHIRSEMLRRLQRFLTFRLNTPVTDIFDVIVIGGGIAGMTAAWELKKLGVDTLLLEADNQLGGRLRRSFLDSTPFDVGAQFFTVKSGIHNLIHDFGLTEQETLISPKLAIALNPQLEEQDLVYFNLRSPWSGSGGAIFKPFSRLLWKMAKEPRLAWSVLQAQLFNHSHADVTNWSIFDTDETTSSWVTRCFGENALEYIFAPLLQGFLFARPENTSRAIPIWLMGALLRQNIYTLKNGFGSLVETLTSRLEGTARTGVEVMKIEVQDNGKVFIKTPIATYRASRVILAVPPPIAKKIYCPTDGAEQTLLNDISYEPTIVVTAKTRKNWRPPLSLDGVYTLFPLQKQASIFASICFKSEGPQNFVQVYFCPEQSRKLMMNDEHSIENLAWHDIEVFFPHFRHSIESSTVTRWTYALPQFPPGSIRKAASYRTYLHQKDPPVILVGDGYNLPGTDAAYYAGRTSAEFSKKYHRAAHGDVIPSKTNEDDLRKTSPSFPS